MATYTATVGARGQVTIPKPLRDLLGLTADNNKINLEARDNIIYISRAKSLDESLAEIEEVHTAEMRQNPTLRANVERYAGMTASEFRAAWLQTAQSKKLYKDRYDVQS